MKSTEPSPSAQVLRKTPPEEFDLVIPVDTWFDGCCVDVCWRTQARRQSLTTNTLAALARMACLASKNIIHTTKIAALIGWKFGVFQLKVSA